jgi:4-diphosphocytidyl-2C-methyl-D-erythritol kinase
MTTVRVFAPAKINLTLHVVGRRADGYHLLDSLVTFADVGDELVVSPGRGGLTLTVRGPEAEGVPVDASNLALRAAAILAEGDGAAIDLLKTLPAASGIGGGSADAAAALRAMMALRGIGRTALTAGFETRAADILALGADVPMCLFPRPLRARGIGERIDAAALPTVAAVLVNPRVGLPTAEVFRALERRDNPGMPDALPTPAMRRRWPRGSGIAATIWKAPRSGCSRWWPPCLPRSRRRGVSLHGCRDRGPRASGSMRGRRRRRGRERGSGTSDRDGGWPRRCWGTRPHGRCRCRREGFRPAFGGAIHCQPPKLPRAICGSMEAWERSASALS